MKLLLPTTFFTLLIQQPTSHAFAPLLHRQQHSTTTTNNRLTTHLSMVGFKDPRQAQTAETMKALGLLNDETQKVKKWLNELMSPDEEESATGAEVESPVEDIGLFGGGGMLSTAPPSSVNLPSYKPSLRSNIGNSILVTGTYHPTLLRVLNNNDFGSRDNASGGESGDLIPNFDFNKIILSIQGEEAAQVKKRVVSRDNRYSGLLDKLIVEESEGYLPSKEKMEGVGSWIVRVEYSKAGEMLPQVAELAKECSGLKNVVVLVEGVENMSMVEGWGALLEDGASFQSTLLAVGELYDQGVEGKFCHIGEVGGESTIEVTNDDAKAPRMLASDAYLTLANLLALECTGNKALGVYEYSAESMQTIATPRVEQKMMFKDGQYVADEASEKDEWESVKYANRMVRAMREMGFSRLAELDVLLARGVDAYVEFLNAPPKSRTQSTEEDTKREKLDELDDQIMSKFNEELTYKEAKRQMLAMKKMTSEIKSMARDWAIRQYDLKSLAGEVGDMTEREFITSIWQEAVEEGKKLYQVVKSGVLEEEKKRRKMNKNQYFYEGMDEREKKKRAILLEKAKDQYLEAYVGDEDLEDEVESLAVDKST